MKFPNFILIIFLIVIGCSKKEDPAPSIIGTWTEVTTASSGCNDAVDNVTINCTAGNCTTIVITSNTLVEGLNFYTITIQGDKLTLTPLGTSVSVTVTFTVTATTLTIISQDTPAQGNCTNTSTYSRKV